MLDPLIDKKRKNLI